MPNIVFSNSIVIFKYAICYFIPIGSCVEKRNSIGSKIGNSQSDAILVLLLLQLCTSLVSKSECQWCEVEWLKPKVANLLGRMYPFNQVCIGVI